MVRGLRTKVIKTLIEADEGKTDPEHLEKLATALIKMLRPALDKP